MGSSQAVLRNLQNLWKQLLRDFPGLTPALVDDLFNWETGNLEAILSGEARVSMEAIARMARLANVPAASITQDLDISRLTSTTRAFRDPDFFLHTLQQRHRDMQPFGPNLKALLKQRRWRAEQLAEATGASIHTVYKWMQGLIPSRTMLATIAGTCQVSVDDLLHWNRCGPQEPGVPTISLEEGDITTPRNAVRHPSTTNPEPDARTHPTASSLDHPAEDNTHSDLSVEALEMAALWQTLPETEQRKIHAFLKALQSRTTSA